MDTALVAVVMAVAVGDVVLVDVIGFVCGDAVVALFVAAVVVLRVLCCGGRSRVVALRCVMVHGVVVVEWDKALLVVGLIVVVLSVSDVCGCD